MRTLDPTVPATPPGPARRGHIRERKQPNRLAALFYAVFPLLAAAGVLFVLVIIGGKALEGYQMVQEAKAVQNHIDDLRKENRQLNQKLEYYKSDAYIEKVAREVLGLVRPGEVPVVVISPDSGGQSSLAAPTPTPEAPPTQPAAPTWQRWLSVFVDQQ